MTIPIQASQHLKKADSVFFFQVVRFFCAKFLLEPFVDEENDVTVDRASSSTVELSFRAEASDWVVSCGVKPPAVRNILLRAGFVRAAHWLGGAIARRTRVSLTWPAADVIRTKLGCNENPLKAHEILRHACKEQVSRLHC